jgi:hypothetical protein
MGRFSKQNKINDLVEAKYHLLPVINRFGISLGNKDKSLYKICQSQNIDIGFFWSTYGKSKPAFVSTTNQKKASTKKTFRNRRFQTFFVKAF